MNYKINFDEGQILDLKNAKKLLGITGLYFIYLRNYEIQYPFGKSQLIYIGMSEKKTNSIGKRLMQHYNGESGNIGLYNYQKLDDLYFTYLNFTMLKSLWPYKIEDLESYFILDFVKNYGVYPICNNKTGLEITQKEIN
ncbi:MAG: hypothetical protein N3A69_17930, partial [Leptospiraceae bacterium]|nr:hypothetical protein [Leptospiraceae bacterium]